MVSEIEVARAVSGDREAFQAIVASYEVRIYRFLYNMVNNRELAQDLTQDTFLSAYSNIQKTDSNLKLGAWLYTIARNHALRELRRRKIVGWIPLFRQSYEGGPEEEIVEAATPDPAQGIVDRQVLKDALGRLDSDSRAMLLMTAEGLSYSEIGQTMGGLTVPVVRQRIYRARERLRSLGLDQEG